MAKVTKPLIGLEISGDLGDRIVYSKRHRMQLVKAKAQPKDAKSTAQLYWRSMFLKVVELWHALSPGEKASWESRGTAHHMTGYDYFISQALRPNPGIYLPLSGGTMTGDIDMDSNKITGLPDPIQPHHAASKGWVDANRPAGPYTAGCRVYKSSNTSIPRDTPFTFVFNTEEYDTDGIFDAGVSGTNFVIQTAGKYIVGWDVQWGGGSTGTYRQLYMKKNGTTVHSIFDFLTQYSTSIRHTVMGVLSLAVNDIITFTCYNNSVSDPTIYFTTGSPYAYLQRIG